jgi:hypothetical protein
VSAGIAAALPGGGTLGGAPAWLHAGNASARNSENKDKPVAVRISMRATIYRLIGCVE